MPIDILTVEEDLNTPIQVFEGIEANNDFYHFIAVAKEMNLILLATIDEGGDTIINQPQLEIFIREIQQMRSRHDINQEILNKLQKAADSIKPYNCEYIKFMGD